MRQDLRKQVTLYPPEDHPDQTPQKMTLLNARDLINHAGWSTTKRPDAFTSVNDIMKTASAEDTDAEKARKELLAKPISKMDRTELQAYAEEVFGTKLDKRLNQQKMIDRISELATASGMTIDLGGGSDNDDDVDEGVQGAKEREAAREPRDTEEGVQGAKKREAARPPRETEEGVQDADDEEGSEDKDGE